MKNAVRWVVLLVVVGLAAAPAGAAELRLTGFIDNVFPHFRSNISQADGDLTRNEDQTHHWAHARAHVLQRHCQR